MGASAGEGPWNQGPQPTGNSLAFSPWCRGLTRGNTHMPCWGQDLSAAQAAGIRDITAPLEVGREGKAQAGAAHAHPVR